MTYVGDCCRTYAQERTNTWVVREAQAIVHIIPYVPKLLTSS